jgi:hypothetical protein
MQGRSEGAWRHSLRIIRSDPRLETALRLVLDPTVAFIDNLSEVM